MATPQDNEMLCRAIKNTVFEAANTRNIIDTILLVGIREPNQIELIKGTLRESYFPQLADRIETCDFDEGLNPTIVDDLSHPDPIPAMYDMVVCANTLMYVDVPLRGLRKLRHASRKRLILLEPVYRERPRIPEAKRDGTGDYHDINRFYSMEIVEKIRENNPEFLLQTDRFNIEIESIFLASCWAYYNPTPDKIGGLWIFKE